MELVSYALVLILVVFIVFAAFQLWCVFALNIMNPVLSGLNAPTTSMQYCGRTADFLKRANEWGKQIRIPQIPTITVSIPPDIIQLLISAGILITMVFLVALIINLLSKINIDLSKIYDDIIKMLAGATISRIFGGYKKERSANKKKLSKMTNYKPGSIFISYRRKDSADVVGHIYDDLVKHFRKDTIFMDVDSIPLGIDFKNHISKALSNCKVVLAVIGDRWLDKDIATGKSRLENKQDFVRIEIESALERNIHVIPLLVRGATIPSKEDIPFSLERLLAHNGTPIRPNPDFHNDMKRLVKALKQILDH